jgi:Plant transposon protein
MDEDLEDAQVFSMAIQGASSFRTLQAEVLVALASLISLEAVKRKRDHRTLPRKKKRVFQHKRALDCIRHDFQGPDALFIGKDFKMFFRISRSRFQNMLEMFGNHGGSFYSGKADCCRNPTASLEAKLLMPLHVLATGVATHTFCYYYQMSNTLAATACREFNKTYLKLYRKKYLKRPDRQDMVNIAKLHDKVHGVPGMFGSLDCMHTKWKNCPVGWQGSFKGGKGYPSIVLEAICDYHCYFWHLDYGHAGTNNDINVLHASDFYQTLLDGRMHELEKDVVPFVVSDQSFDQMYVLTDGAYPQFDRFVKPLRFAVQPEEHKFMNWQSAARKDIERAFGILQGKFQAVARPIMLHSIKEVATMVKCCLCMHNMCVADRVMNGDFEAAYNPNNILDSEPDVQQNSLFRSIQRKRQRAAGLQGINEPGTAIGIASTRAINPSVYGVITRRERFKSMVDLEQNKRLKQALINKFKL